MKKEMYFTKRQRNESKRIEGLIKITCEGKMYAHTTPTEYDRKDLFLSKQKTVERNCFRSTVVGDCFYSSSNTPV